MYKTSNGAYTNSISLALDQPFNDNHNTIEGLHIRPRIDLIGKGSVEYTKKSKKK